jgi:LacI family transcriptional regulator
VVEAAKRLGLPPARLVEGNNEMDGGEAGARALLEEPEPPTAIMCGNDLAALGAIRALAEAGLRVPADVSVIGADDISFARYGTPALTTSRIPRDRLGRLAFEALDRMLRTKHRLPTDISLETHLVVRESTGPAHARPAARGLRPNGESHGTEVSGSTKREQVPLR